MGSARGRKLEGILWAANHHIVFTSYMQKTCDVAEKAILAQKNCGKVRKSRQNVNRDKSA